MEIRFFFLVYFTCRLLMSCRKNWQRIWMEKYKNFVNSKRKMSRLTSKACLTASENEHHNASHELQTEAWKLFVAHSSNLSAFRSLNIISRDSWFSLWVCLSLAQSYGLYHWHLYWVYMKSSAWVVSQMCSKSDNQWSGHLLRLSVLSQVTHSFI